MSEGIPTFSDVTAHISLSALSFENNIIASNKTIRHIFKIRWRFSECYKENMKE